MNKKICINCNRTDEVIPLIAITFKGEEKHICPQCLPVLIHKTQTLADKFPGIDASVSPKHEH